MDPDQTARMRRLVWINAGRKRTMFLSLRGSNHLVIFTVKEESTMEVMTGEKDTSLEHNVSDPLPVDTSLNTESSATATESSVTLDNSMAEILSSTEKKKQKRKTKAELKAELKEQKVMERKSRRQRIRNKR
jgi:hypothetical protein